MLKKILTLCLVTTLSWACDADDDTDMGTTMMAGAETAGMDTAGMDTAGMDTAGMDTAGMDTAGMDTAGMDTAGMDTAGMDTAGTEMSTAWTEPSDFVAAFNAVEGEIVTKRDEYCVDCADTEVCGDEFTADDNISIDDAGCVFIESTSDELATLQTFVECLQDWSSEVQMCISNLMMCDDQQFEDCLYTMNPCVEQAPEEYLNRIGVACFGQAEDFICEDGTAIPGDYVCDGGPDCPGGEDEAECASEAGFICDDDTMIPSDYVCDGDTDCDGGEDEAECMSEGEEFTCNDGSTIPAEYVCDEDADCDEGEDEAECP